MPRRALGAAMAAAWILGGGAAAQVARESATPPGITFTRPPDPPPQSPPSAQPPGRDAHHPGAPAPPPGGDLFLAGPDTYAPRYDRRTPPRPLHPPYGYIVPGYVPAAPVDTIPYPRPPHAQRPPAGFLGLRVLPQTAQVYVDGFLAGTVEDFRGSEYALGPGPHRVEIRADGFETRTVDIRLRAGETLTYRGELERIVLRPADATSVPASSAPRVVPVTAKTIYVIPRCYAGDRLPDNDDLPPGCSVSDVRVLKP